jgi:hypothetical protein
MPLGARADAVLAPIEFVPKLRRRQGSPAVLCTDDLQPNPARTRKGNQNKGQRVVSDAACVRAYVAAVRQCGAG